MVLQLEFGRNGDGGRLVWSNLTDSSLRVPKNAKDVSAFRGTESIPILRPNTWGTAYIGDKAYKGKIITNHDDNIISVVADGTTTIICAPTMIEIPNEDEWIFEGDPAGVTVHAEISDISWTPAYRAVLSENNMKSFAMMARITNRGDPVTASKIIFKDENISVQNAHKESRYAEYPDTSMSTNYKRHGGEKSMLVESISAVVRKEGIIDFQLDSPPPIERTLVVPLWQLKDVPINREYMYYGSNAGYNILLEEQKFAPSGYIKIYNEDMTHFADSTYKDGKICNLITTDIVVTRGAPYKTSGMFGKDAIDLKILCKKVGETKLHINVGGWPKQIVTLTGGAEATVTLGGK